MSRKISICGPRNIAESELGNCEVIGRGVAELARKEELILATGGTAGFPMRVAEEIKRYNPQAYIEAYTPCTDEKEWDELFKRGIASSRKLYDRIFYSTDDGDFRMRALKRIPRLLKDSGAVLAYINQNAGNTYVELFTSRSLTIPTIVLSRDSRISESLNNLVNSGFRIFLEPSVVIDDIRRILGENKKR